MTQNDSNPYVGPRPFERKAEDAARFFGRSQETEEIVSLIFGHPVTLVYAQSGAGKTSLFNASVTTDLEENGFDVLPLTRVGGVVPKGILLKEIKNLYIFNALLKMDSGAYPRTLVSTSLCTFLEKRVRATDETGQPRPRVIIFDQFEELFTYTPEEWREQREDFFQQVVEALDADPLLRVVFVIREDFLAELDPYARALPEHLRTRYRLERLGENAALQAIKDPLTDTTRKFAPGVAEDLVKELLIMRAVDATGKTAEIVGQYIEPVQLQVVCVTLWSTLETEVTEIEKTHLKNFNVSDALSNFYKSAVEATAKETGVPETNLRNWFGKTLITPMGTRSTVFRGEETTGGINNSAVDFLEGRHIIRAEFRAGARWYELTHDRLVEPILASNQKWMETLSPLQRQATLWSDQGKHETWLFGDQALTEVEQWAKEHENQLTGIEKEFLNECRTHQKDIDQKKELQDQQQKLVAEKKLAGQRRKIANVSIAATIVTLVLAVIALLQTRQARTAQATAEANLLLANTEQANALMNQELADANAATAAANAQVAENNAALAQSSLLAAEANSLQEVNLQTSLLLGIETYKKALERNVPNTQASGALLNAAQANPRLTQFLSAHTSKVFAVDFSADGQILASASNDAVIMWDTKTGMPKGEPIRVHTGEIISIALSPNGKIIVLGDLDNTIHVWDVQTRKETHQLLEHSHPVSALAFSPDNTTLASGDTSGTIILWDMESARPIEPSLIEHTDAISSLDFSPDGETLASGSWDSTAILWNVGRRSMMGEPMSSYISAVTGVTFSQSGKILATGSCSKLGNDNCSEGEVALWNVETRQLIGAPFTGHTGSVSSLSFNGNDTIIASSADTDKNIILWDVQTGQLAAPPLTAHTDAVNSVDFRSDGNILASGSSDKNVILWDVTADQRMSETLAGHTDYVLTTNFSPDGKTLASGSWDNTVILWNVQSHEQSAQLTDMHNSAVSAVAFSPDGKTLASAGYDNRIVLWDLTDPQRLQKKTVDHTNLFTSIAFSPDGKQFATGSCSELKEGNCITGEVILWDTETQQMIGQPITGHANYVSSIAFTPDGKTLISGSYDNTIVIWELATREQIAELNAHTDAVTSIALSSDGHLLASGSWDRTIIVWDMDKLQPIGQPLTGHTDGITSVAFSSDNMLLASGSSDRTVILWDVQTGQSIGQPLTGQTDTVSSVAFQPKGAILASGSYDGTVILWDLNPDSLIDQACQRAGRNFTQVEWDRYFRNEEYGETCEQWVLEPGVTVTPTAASGPTSTLVPSATPTVVLPTATPAQFIVDNLPEAVTLLNLRAGPGTKYDVISLIAQGTIVQVKGEGVQVNNSIWVPVTYKDATGKEINGWVNSSYLTRKD